MHRQHRLIGVIFSRLRPPTSTTNSRNPATAPPSHRAYYFAAMKHTQSGDPRDRPQSADQTARSRRRTAGVELPTNSIVIANHQRDRRRRAAGQSLTAPYCGNKNIDVPVPVRRQRRFPLIPRGVANPLLLSEIRHASAAGAVDSATSSQMANFCTHLRRGGPQNHRLLLGKISCNNLGRTLS